MRFKGLMPIVIPANEGPWDVPRGSRTRGSSVLALMSLVVVIAGRRDPAIQNKAWFFLHIHRFVCHSRASSSGIQNLDRRMIPRLSFPRRRNLRVYSLLLPPVIPGRDPGSIIWRRGVYSFLLFAYCHPCESIVPSGLFSPPSNRGRK